MSSVHFGKKIALLVAFASLGVYASGASAASIATPGAKVSYSTDCTKITIEDTAADSKYAYATVMFGNVAYFQPEAKGGKGDIRTKAYTDVPDKVRACAGSNGTIHKCSSWLYPASSCKKKMK